MPIKTIHQVYTVCVPFVFILKIMFDVSAQVCYTSDAQMFVILLWRGVACKATAGEMDAPVQHLQSRLASLEVVPGPVLRVLCACVNKAC